MLQRTLGSGWGVLLPGLLITGLMYADLSPDQWRIVILMRHLRTVILLFLILPRLVRGGGLEPPRP